MQTCFKSIPAISTLGRFCSLVCMGLILLMSCSPSRKINYTRSREQSDLRLSIGKLAQHWEGKKYRYGGTGKAGFDCSGLVYLVYAEHSIKLPRTAASQSKVGRKIGSDIARVGDLIFFKQKGKINHVAIITGRDKVHLYITHSTTSKGVITENLLTSPYWMDRMISVRDVLGDR